MASAKERHTATGFEDWLEAEFERHLSELRWAEIARALTSLSSDYVHRRSRVAQALDGRGKRAAFALYYAPRHHALVRAVLSGVGSMTDRESAAAGRTTHAAALAVWRPSVIVDLGCGNGVAGVAWSTSLPEPAPVLGVDTQAWALAEARSLSRALGIPFRGAHTDLDRLRWPTGRAGIVAAFTVNELADTVRSRLWSRIETRVAAGDALLVLEPLAKRVAPWWPEWARAAREAGGRDDEWRFELEHPERVAALGRSAGLDPRDLGCRSLWVPPRAPS